MSNFVLRRPSDASFITQPTVQPAPRSYTHPIELSPKLYRAICTTRPSLSTCSMMCANDPTCNVFSTVRFKFNRSLTCFCGISLQDYNDGCKLGQLAGGAVEAAPAHGTQVMADASLFGKKASQDRDFMARNNKVCVRTSNRCLWLGIQRVRFWRHHAYRRRQIQS